ncbi:MAG: phosphoglycerate dehydrogenase [Spirochaetia bacterium]|nr:phosphoglycerate dehydrogenase [Spirochaetia bacterium]
MKHTILISDKFDAEGVARLQAHPDLNVIYSGGTKRDELLKIIPDVHGLIIRSATTVDAEVLAVAKNLKIVVRAGVGVDNINIPEASRHGVIVMNSPGGNSVSTAEQAIGLLMAMARNLPQANASTRSGKWEKSKFLGVEITGKTLGVVGLGRIGKEVVRRAKGLRMRVIGYDPFIPAANLSNLEIDIVTPEEILKQSDFITVHAPLTDTTRDFVNKGNLSMLKKGVRLINCARGGIYNEEALAEGLSNGIIAGAAIDVFVQEPIPADHPLLKLENCIVTPHLGASTGDAEFAVAMDTVEQVVDFFTKGVARYSLNFPTMDPETLDFLAPYFKGGEKIGRLLSQFLEGDLNSIEIEYLGEIEKYMSEPVTSAILRGALQPALGDEVNFVNAPFLVKDRGIKVTETKRKECPDYSSTVNVTFSTSKGHSAHISFTALQKKPMVVSFQGLPIEFEPEGILLMIQNRDVPRVVGTLGMFLGDQNVNIAHLELGRDARGGTARCVVTTDELISNEAIAKMKKLENILSVVQVDLR